MTAFATVQDVIVRWRPLTTDESATVEVLLDDASDMIRVRWSDIDSRITSGAISADTLTRITAGMVRRAMLNRDSEGITQGSEIVGPFQKSQSYANPNGNLYLSADDILALDGYGYNPRVVQAWLV